MRLAVSALAIAVVLSSCAKGAHEEGEGGSPGSGGVSGKGGSGSGGKGTGGKQGTGGAAGATTPAGPCDDVGTAKSIQLTGQYDHGKVAVEGSDKDYIFQANWWLKFDSFKETLDGLSFTFNNPNGTSVTSADNSKCQGCPMGFPSLFIGSYGQNYTSKGSNLPIVVSSIKSVSTVFSTNSDSIGKSNYNATYDVWFTKSAAPVTGNDPGAGGAYLMVWQFLPSDRQPRGQPASSGRTVGNVPGVWNVWYDPSTDQMPCVSYVSLQPQSSLEFDLNDFIKDAIKGNWGVTSNQYLSIIFAGFEVWGGADGLQLKKFCANVQ